jgi:hypothetical protein
MSNDRFHHEDDITVAYDAAELVLESYINRDILLLMDERARRQTIGTVARAIADAVIRSDPSTVNGDITELAGVNIERATKLRS